ncbi:MAG: methyl-accepting chemotaxis protein [Gallionellaceae bacterium]
MRMNTPVTNVEYELRDDSSIVSKTDLKGLITYVNPEFIEAAGFTEKELIGQPHNMVRHPDMPEQAFADLWATLKNGRPWTGMVKNRRKNGEHYWVVANATPIFEGASCTGYMSVRSKPTRTQVDGAAAAYRLFKEGRQGNLRIKEGKVVKNNPLQKLNVFARMTIKARLIMVIAVLSVLLVAIGGVGLVGMDKADEGLRTVYEDRTIALAQVTDIGRAILRNRIAVADAIIDADAASSRRHLNDIAINATEISKTWAAFTSTYLTPEEKKLVTQFDVNRSVFVTDGLKPAMALLGQGRYAEAKIKYEHVEALYQPVRHSIDALNKLQLDVAKSEYEAAKYRYSMTRNFAIGLISIGLLFAVSLGWFVIRGMVRSLEAARHQMLRISQGHYNDEIEVTQADEIGLLLYSMKSMQIRMGFEVSDSRRMANEAMRVKVALDNVGTGVMIADKGRNIIYMNKSVVNVLSKVEADIQKVMPHFSVANLMGANIDQFHKNPAHQHQILESFNKNHDAEITLAGHTFALSACPVINEQGERLGSAIEWRDRTVEVGVEKEVADIVNAAANGDFTRRISMDGKEGFFKQLGVGMNNLMQTSTVGLDEVVRVLGALAKGDLTETIVNEYQGTFGQLKDDSNSTVAQLTEVISRIKDATDTINTASKEIASGNTDLSQRTEEQASSLEETAASMEQITSTVKQNAENAKQANKLASGASEIAVKGGEVVSKVVQTMSSISASSNKIVDIISVIDGIAFQTNILALNAAVEAARAGEQGRGFAVVASEVRNLAQRSAAAAKEIKTLINDSVDKVAVGTNLADNAGNTMDEVVDAVKRVTDIMSEISAASVEQSSGIEQVNQAITQMDDVTQQNAALVEQAAAAAESLEEQAQELSQLISTFQLSGESVAPSVAYNGQRSLPAPTRPTAPQGVAKLPSKTSRNEEETWKEC